MKRLISCVAPLGALVLAIAGCGGGQSYSVTGRGPALSADARIDVSPAGANRQVVVSVDHLLPPERLGRQFSTYTVWIVPPGGNPVPAGRLEYDRARRRGRLTTITPYEDFRVLVTAEPEMPLGAPSRAVVLSQDVIS
jgi:hypothetical protein